MTRRWVALDADGEPLERGLPMPAELAENNRALAGFLRSVGCLPPWVGYVCLVREGGAERAVGGGAFKGPPRDGRVEIAYFTVAAEQRRGHAAATARWLVAVAQAADPGLILCAETLPERNASARILERLGFVVTGTAQDDEAGLVWHWELAPVESRARAEAGGTAGASSDGTQAEGTGAAGAAPGALLPPDAAHRVPPTPRGVYRHYKGALYEVLACVRHSETEEALVLYRPLAGDSGLWVRPHGMFFERVFVDGQERPRFERQPD
jgi:RimJ/RimL family protein N-acetyltransferase